MRAKVGNMVHALMLLAALAVAACSVAPATAPTAQNTSAAGATPASGYSQTMSSDPTIAAIQKVIQKADQEQQDAFNKQDPTIMKDTSTVDYYNQLVQINSQMAQGGVSSIKLIQIEWGPVNFPNSTTAQTNTFETWQTAYTDGSSDQSRTLNAYTLVQQQGNWLIQTDDHPNSGSGSSGASPASGPLGGAGSASPTATPVAAGTPASRTQTSRNWAGYAATSGTFTSVTGTWNVHQALTSGSFGADATWIGIGGVNTRDLIQAGTEETTVRTGAAEWDAWIELLPQTSRPVQLGVKPGDSVTVSISQQGPANQWLIQMKNNTTGETYQTTVSYQSSMSSAEWVEEAPSAGGRGGTRILPLDNFGTVQFSGCTAVDNGKTVTIAQSGAKPQTLDGPGGNALVTPSVLTPDGQGFTVTRAN